MYKSCSVRLGKFLEFLFLLSLVCPFLPAQSERLSVLPIPVGLDVCEGGCLNSDGNLGTWIFHGQKKGKAQWSRGGQVATVTIQRFDTASIRILREDLPTSSFPGFTAYYEGKM